MNYIIRKMEKEDCAKIAHVVTLAWNETYKGIVPDSFLEELKTNEKERSERALLNYEEDNTTLVLEVDGKVVGFAFYSESRDKEFSNCGEIYALYVLKKYHGNGYGRKLVEEAKKKLKELGFDKMLIHCLDGNPANEFYKHIGGKHIKDGVYERLNLPDKVYYYEI